MAERRKFRPREQSNPRKYFFERYTRELQYDPNLAERVRMAEHEIAAKKPDLEVDANVLLCMFNKPGIAVQFPLSSLAIARGFDQVRKTGRKRNLLINGFFVLESDGELKVTRAVSPDEHTGTINPALIGAGIPDSQDLALVASLLCQEDVLKPDIKSGIDIPDETVASELLVFPKMRKLREDDIKVGKRPQYVKNPLLILKGYQPFQDVERMLFLIETDELEKLDSEGYTAHLKDNQPRMEGVKTDEEAVGVLREMGYKASSLSIPDMQYYGRFPFTTVGLVRVIEELGLAA